MGWGRMLLLGNIGQQMDLEDLEQEISGLKRKLNASRTRHEESARDFEQLAAEHDELKLYVAAILRVLVSKGVVSRPELEELIRTVDAEDGRSDSAHRGRIDPPGDAESPAARDRPDSG